MCRGATRAALEAADRALPQATSRCTGSASEPSLEDVFIDLMSDAPRTISNERARPHCVRGDSGSAPARCCSRNSFSCARDRVSFAMIVDDSADAASAVRLCHQHHAARSADRRAAAGRQRCRPLDPQGAGEHPLFQDHASGQRTRPNSIGCWLPARCCSRSRYPRGFERALRRGDRPALLVAADATDPVAAGSALGALTHAGADGAAERSRDAGHRQAAVRDPHACALQPGGGDRAQHRARAWSAPSSP